MIVIIFINRLYFNFLLFNIKGTFVFECIFNYSSNCLINWLKVKEKVHTKQETNYKAFLFAAGIGPSELLPDSPGGWVY